MPLKHLKRNSKLCSNPECNVSTKIFFDHEFDDLKL